MPQPLYREKDRFCVSSDNQLLDIDAIHRYLNRSSWAAGIDIDTVRLSIAHSLNFGLYHAAEQIGFARVVTDFATFGYLCDVYVLEEYQQQGLGRWLMECCHSHPLLSEKLRRIMLVTSTAPWLYEKIGYCAANQPDFVWQMVRPDIYQRK
ncbi:GNAT family N-acetyltransferase [Pantoea sp. B65]|uniref:GNAT family N-acetyltransferase n=1 Tax=Pantoea sp. B65 TaxID=2813359 RepID=UPI0039B63F15